MHRARARHQIPVNAIGFIKYNRKKTHYIISARTNAQSTCSARHAGDALHSPYYNPTPQHTSTTPTTRVLVHLHPSHTRTSLLLLLPFFARACARSKLIPDIFSYIINARVYITCRGYYIEIIGRACQLTCHADEAVAEQEQGGQVVAGRRQ